MHYNFLLQKQFIEIVFLIKKTQEVRENLGKYFLIPRFFSKQPNGLKSHRNCHIHFIF